MKIIHFLLLRENFGLYEHDACHLNRRNAYFRIGLLRQAARLDLAAGGRGRAGGYRWGDFHGRDGTLSPCDVALSLCDVAISPRDMLLTWVSWAQGSRSSPVGLSLGHSAWVSVEHPGWRSVKRPGWWSREDPGGGSGDWKSSCRGVSSSTKELSDSEDFADVYKQRKNRCRYSLNNGASTIRKAKDTLFMLFFSKNC